MTIAKWLARARIELQSSDTATLDAEILLCNALGLSKAQLYAYPDKQIKQVTLNTLGVDLTRRKNGEPTAYIVGKQEFYGRDFTVNEHVLIPRPESESIIELVKKHLPQSNISIADIGTGSGALGVTLSLELLKSTVHLYDIDPSVLTVATLNAQKHNASVKCYTADLLSPSHGPYDAIVANLPYVPDDYEVNKAATLEPSLALYGGEDGLDLYRRLLEQVDGLIHKPLFVCTESLDFQHVPLAELAKRHGFIEKDKDGLVQLFSLLG